MRTWRVIPTVAAAAVFLLIANLLLVAVLGGARPEPGDPEHEAWLLYYAVIFPAEPPEALDQKGLRELLEALHPDAEAVADRFEVVGYTRRGRHFELELVHDSGQRYRITLGGVFHG